MTKISSAALQELCPLPKVKMKKAQGMSVNTIVVAIIVLIVLVILVLLLSGYFRGWGKSMTTCHSQGGTCVPTYDQCVSIGDVTQTSLPISAEGCGSNQKCCPNGYVGRGDPAYTGDY
jgi:hypothetical protein